MRASSTNYNEARNFRRNETTAHEDEKCDDLRRRMTGLPHFRIAHRTCALGALFLTSTFHDTSIFISCFLFFATSVVPPPLQERLLGLQGGGTGAGGGDSEQMMLAGLAPEGTREWHDRRSGLPTGATKTVVAGEYEQVAIALKSLINVFIRTPTLEDTDTI